MMTAWTMSLPVAAAHSTFGVPLLRGVTPSNLKLVAGPLRPSLYHVNVNATCALGPPPARVEASALQVCASGGGTHVAESSNCPVPSGFTMAEFLVHFRKSLESASPRASGDGVAATGADVVNRIRAWLSTLHGHPQQGFHHCTGATWHKTESAVEQCLWDLEKDLRRIAQRHEQFPASLDVQLACLHCSEAATLLRHL